MTNKTQNIIMVIFLSLFSISIIYFYSEISSEKYENVQSITSKFVGTNAEIYGSFEDGEISNFEYISIMRTHEKIKSSTISAKIWKKIKEDRGILW